MKVLESVAELIGNLAPKVQEKVVEAMVERELNKRSEAVVQGLDLLSRLEKDFKKIKPDNVVYGGDGAVMSEGFSKAKLDELNNTTKQINKLKDALTKALENADYGELYNLTTNKK